MTTTQTPAHKRFLSPSEVAAELGVSKSSIYRAVDSGHLPAVRLQPLGALRIPAEALEPEEKHRAGTGDR
jgi:excisionase family DNA binding protein